MNSTSTPHGPPARSPAAPLAGPSLGPQARPGAGSGGSAAGGTGGIALRLTPQLTGVSATRPGQPWLDTPRPGQPAGLLAQLGKGTISALDTAADGRLRPSAQPAGSACTTAG